MWRLMKVENYLSFENSVNLSPDPKLLSNHKLFPLSPNFPGENTKFL